MTETDLEMTERHVAEGAERIVRQRALLHELQTDGHAQLAEEAAKLLRQFEQIQMESIAHRDRLARDGRK